MSDLFIIGAGASVPYGFPCGEKLLEEIKSLESSAIELRREIYRKVLIYNSHHIVDGKIFKKILSDLNNSLMTSIDDFIRNKNSESYEYNIIIKRIIAAFILRYENNMKRGSNWIEYLLTSIDRRDNAFKKFFKSRFIIFNYDRVFEHKIFKYLISEKNRSKDMAMEIINKMNIFHLHGYLGHFDKLGFGEEQMENSIPENFETVWDSKNAYIKQIINKAKEYITFSERVFFLGFGYLEENMIKLGLTANTKILAKKKISGTAYKMSDYKIRDIESRLKLCGAMQPNIKDCEAVDLIKDFF